MVTVYNTFMPENKTETSQPHQSIKKFGLNPDAAARIQEELTNIKQKGPDGSSENPHLTAADKLKQKIDDAEKNSTIDHLTGLSNRRGLDYDKTKFEVDRYPILFTSIDLDNLKRINDNFGHGAGDRYIMSFVEFFKTVSRPDDDGYRLGGDEFLIVVRNYNNNQNLKQILEDRMTGSLKKFNKEKLSKGEIDHELEFTFFVEESKVSKRDSDSRLAEVNRALKASDDGEVRLKQLKKAQEKSQNPPPPVL